MKFLLAMTLIIVLTESFSSIAEERKKEDWSDFRILEIHVSTYMQKKCLQRFEDRLKLGVVSPPEFTLPGEYLVPKLKYNYLIRNLNFCGIKHTLLGNNLKQILEQEAKANDYQKTSPPSGRRNKRSNVNVQSPQKPTPYNHFMNSLETNAWLKTLAAQYTNVAKLHGVGTTFEGREMLVMQVGPDANDHYVLMESGIHAREWLSPSANAYLLNEVLMRTSNNETLIVSLLQRFTLFFIINFNPDGYDFTFQQNSTFKACNRILPARFFRKNRQPYGNFVGADPNRNFDSAFYGEKRDRESCSDSYSGPFPFSEKCVKNVASFMNEMKRRNGVPWTLTWSIHCCGKLWILPGSSKEMEVTNEREKEEQLLVAQAAVNGIVREGGNVARSYDKSEWSIGTVQKFLGYSATGASHDWYRTRMGARFTYGIELNRGCNGIRFIACTFQIEESGKQLYSGLISSLLEIVNLGY